MFFRNLTLFRFPESSAKSLKKLESELDEKRLRACGPIELSTRGFVSPYGRDADELVHRIGPYALLTVGSEDKLLPSSVIAEALSVKIAEISEKIATVVVDELRDESEVVDSTVAPNATRNTQEAWDGDRVHSGHNHSW